METGVATAKMRLKTQARRLKYQSSAKVTSAVEKR